MISSSSVEVDTMRVHFAGVRYHVMGQVNQGQSIFEDDRNREHYLEFLKEGEKRFGYRLYACMLGPTVAGEFMIAREKNG